MEENKGLTSEQVRQRRIHGLSNQASVKTGRTEKEIILTNCLTYFNLVFLILASVLVISGSSVKNMTFLIVVIVNTVIGILQQIRAKRAVDKLTLVASQQVRTLRDGVWTQVRSDLLVQDDVVEFCPGDQICADARVLSGELSANESLLTGEADAVEKTAGSTLLSGSFVMSGRAVARLTQVGDAAFASQLAREAKKDPKAAKSEMMHALDQLIRWVGIALIPIGGVLFYQEYRLLQLGFQQSTEAVVAALVGMIPEGLYLLTSVAMAASALKLTKQRVLVQDMNCIESLARVDVLCVDKTGTITEPAMAVERVLPLTDCKMEYLEQVLTALFGSREPDNDTSRALREKFSGESDWQCSRYFPFDSQYKWSGAVFRDRGSFLAGAPERILGARYHTVADTVMKWSSQGYRVLLLAGYDGTLEPGVPEESLVRPLALILLTNPIRKTAPETFRYFAEQGVCVKVISGDSPVTVSCVAQRAGIQGAERYVDAGSLETGEEIFRAAEDYTVFGRVTPDMKKKLLEAMKQQGHTVAMTGDGVNDVLAMREANCSIAMASGARAASQIAQIVLTDSDFSAMPSIVGEGRRVINNIQRAASLFLVKNIFSIGLALACLIAGWAYPFMPFHLTVVTALTIGVPGFFLAMEPNYERVRGRFLSTVLRQALPGGITNIVVVILTHFVMQRFALPAEDSATVCTAVLSAVGMMVLYRVSVPFDRFRSFLWGVMAAALVGCFTLLRQPFELMISDKRSFLVMAIALLMAPTVFYALQRLFALWDRIKAKRK